MLDLDEWIHPGVTDRHIVTPSLAKVVRPANVDIYVVMRTSLNGELLREASLVLDKKDAGSIVVDANILPAVTVPSTTVVVHIWTCQFKKNELPLLKRQICYGLQKSRLRSNVGNRLAASHSQISTSILHHRQRTFPSRIFASFTMSHPSPASSESTMLATSPSGLVKFHCKWQAYRMGVKKFKG